jgi:hypothetical protein
MDSNEEKRAEDGGVKSSNNKPQGEGATFLLMRKLLRRFSRNVTREEL